MVFNSLTFAVFFLVVMSIHYLPLPWKGRKFNLLWASYLFYAAWNPPFVTLLWLSTVVDWYVGKALDRAQGTGKRRLLLAVSLMTNLGLLGFFKYSGFMLDNFVALAGMVGLEYQPALPDIVLPMGISFYTFQTLSYTIDIYRREMRSWDSFLDYALYVTFFPQLVAGPIVRASDFHEQMKQPRLATGREVGWGLTLLVVGLFEKVVVADGLLAPITEKVYDAAGGPSMVDAWCGTLAFAGQIFCDFAGYSTCAIGVAMCLGFAICDNFRFPYAAIGFSDFWRRWHISLSTWLRDYLYITLGGNRRGTGRTYFNLMATMLLGGLWHGASWTFMVWGGLHGLYLVAERLMKPMIDAWPMAKWAVVRFVGAMGTFVLVCITWVFFRASDFPRAFSTIGSMLGRYPKDQRPLLQPADVSVSLVVVGLILVVHWLMRDKTLEEVADRTPSWILSLIIGLMIVAIATAPGEDRAFIYFQF